MIKYLKMEFLSLSANEGLARTAAAAFFAALISFFNLPVSTPANLSICSVPICCAFVCPKGLEKGLLYASATILPAIALFCSCLICAFLFCSSAFLFASFRASISALFCF